MIQIKRLIVETTMLRHPKVKEESSDFFVGYNEEGNAYLLLPTPAGLLEKSYLFALALIQNSEKKYIYELDHKVTAVNLKDLYEFHDDLAFFFGPNNNVLTSFLKSSGYETYIHWVDSRRTKQIDTLLSELNQANNPLVREQLTKKLKRFIGS